MCVESHGERHPLRSLGISSLGPHKLVRQVKLSPHALLVVVVKNSRQNVFFDLQSPVKEKFFQISQFFCVCIITTHESRRHLYSIFGVQWVTVSRLEKRTSGKN